MRIDFDLSQLTDWPGRPQSSLLNLFLDIDCHRQYNPDDNQKIPNDVNNCSPKCFATATLASRFDSTFRALPLKTCKNSVKTAKHQCAAKFVAKVNFFAQFSGKMGQTCNTKSHHCHTWSNEQIHQRFFAFQTDFRDVLDICLIQLFTDDYDNFGVIDDVKSTGTLIEG